MANSKVALLSPRMSASIEQRNLLPFDWNDRSRTLVQIPNEGFYQFGDVIHGPDQRIALPDSDYDYLAENAVADWFLTTTFLFPALASEAISCACPIRRNECLLISFASVDDAMLFVLKSRRARSLPKEWWDEFESAEYRRHALFSGVETSKMGLIRVNGIQQDVGFDAKILVARPNRANRRKQSKCEPISVRNLVQQSWGGEVYHVCNH